MTPPTMAPVLLVVEELEEEDTGATMGEGDLEEVPVGVREGVGVAVDVGEGTMLITVGT